MYILTQNPNWPKPKFIPDAQVICHFYREILGFEFIVSEPRECFRMACKADGDPCWQDSCVEVFLNSPARGLYYNFECSCSGFCLAEYGTQRANRIKFDNYSDIRRIWIQKPDFNNGRYHWRIKIEIPRVLIGLSPDEAVFGNLYKCASATESPHYLSLFPIDTPAPDFHRPEFFGPIRADESNDSFHKGVS